MNLENTDKSLAGMLDKGHVFDDEVFTRTKANIIEYLFDAEIRGSAPVPTPELERGIGERQPTVCKAINDLRDAGFIESERRTKSSTRGSPPHVHRLSDDWRDIVTERVQSHIEGHKAEIGRLEAVKEAIGVEP